MAIKVWVPITYPFQVLNGRTRWSLVIDNIYKIYKRVSFTIVDIGYPAQTLSMGSSSYIDKKGNHTISLEIPRIYNREYKHQFPTDIRVVVLPNTWDPDIRVSIIWRIKNTTSEMISQACWCYVAIPWDK